MRRVLVRGSSGSGKTTLARALAGRLGVPHVELDALFQLADWQHPADEEFRVAVEHATRRDGWVADGNYHIAVDVLRPRADTVVFLDLPRALVMRRLIWRTIRRGIRRQELWNGNRERLSGMFRRDPDDNVVLYAWRAFARRRREAVDATTDPDWAHMRVVVLHTPTEVDDFLTTVSPAR